MENSPGVLILQWAPVILYIPAPSGTLLTHIRWFLYLEMGTMYGGSGRETGIFSFQPGGDKGPCHLLPCNWVRFNPFYVADSEVEMEGSHKVWLKKLTIPMELG